MNRAERRAAAKQKPKLKGAVDWSYDAVFSKPVVVEEPDVPGVNCPPANTESFQYKIDHNIWEEPTDLQGTLDVIKQLSDEEKSTWSWARNHNCKYLNLRIDMRDGGFLILNDENERISMDQLLWQYSSGSK